MTELCLKLRMITIIVLLVEIVISATKMMVAKIYVGIMKEKIKKK